MEHHRRFFTKAGIVLSISLAFSTLPFLSGCSSVSPGYGSDAARVGAPVGELTNSKRYSSPQPEYRPGLGTGWGDPIDSKLRNTSFVRESNQPVGGVATIYYNDQKGIDAMAGSSKKRTSPYGRAANGMVEWGVKSSLGTTHYKAGSKRYVAGRKGQTYSVVIKNVSDSRLEAVLSVDGLDAVDGRPASFNKRGYILSPGERIEVKGFRTSYDAVAAFEFSSVAASYSNLRHGHTRDVGVLGLAVFAEKTDGPWMFSPPGGSWRSESQRRSEARPFAEAPTRTMR